MPGDHGSFPGIGALLVQAVTQGARDLGYQEMWLDTLPSMVDAHKLSVRLRFRELPPYGASVAPGSRFYGLRLLWERSRRATKLSERLAFVLVCKLYRQMYARTGLAADSARANRAALWVRLLSRPCRLLFKGQAMPTLVVPTEGAPSTFRGSAPGR